MNKQEMLSQMDAVRAAVADCLDDQTEITAIEIFNIFLGFPASVHMASVLDLGRCFEGVNIDINEDYSDEFIRMSVVAQGVEFFCLSRKSVAPIEEIDVPAETLSGLSGQEVSP